MMTYPFQQFSISTRLAVWYGLSFLLMLSVFVVFLYASFHLSLHHDFNDQMQADTERTLEMVSGSSNEPRLVSDDALSSGAYTMDGSAGTYVRVLSSDGEVLHRSANFPAAASFSPRPPAGTLESNRGHSWQGAPARSTYASVRGPDGSAVGWVEITRLESAVHRELHRLGWLLAVGIVLGTGVAAVAGHRLARRALRPVTDITQAARRIEAEDLRQRLPTEFGVHDELTELAETLNGLLERLDASFTRERRFRADAAHEMFTPLSAIQSETDVALRMDRSPPAYRQSLEAVRRHAGRMSTIVEDLLELSRAEALRVDEVGPVDVGRAVAGVVDEFRGRAADQDIEIRIRTDSSVEARITPSDLVNVVTNLIDNAIKYTPEKGCVEAAVRLEGRHAVVRVKDTGIGLSGEQKEQLFDRFYRAGNGKDVRGSGLGLSIAQAIVAAYGGTLDAESSGAGEGSTFTVRLPRA
ncbi:MAG: ATP-binding protein [Rhodothermales bacterium]